MPKPTVTGFTPTTILNNGQTGLKNGNGKQSQATLAGWDMAAGMTVKVWGTNRGNNSKPNWSGPLTVSSNQFVANLTCSNDRTVDDDHPMETEYVTVTVTAGNETSDPYNDPDSVNEGP